MKKIEKIHFMGPAWTLKTKLILELLCDMGVNNDYEFVVITEANSGIVVDFCKDRKLKYIVVDSDDQEKMVNTLKEDQADLMISIGWDKIIPKEILEIYPFKPINCHSSLLPDYRGRRVYMSIYANVEDYYGTTIHYINEKLDDGNILVQGKLKMFLEETPEIIHRRISELTAMLLPLAIQKVEQGNPGKQQSGIARYFEEIDRKTMTNYRIENINRIRTGKKKIVTPHRIIKKEVNQ